MIASKGWIWTVENVGAFLHELAYRLWPITRSITGEGLRDSLRILKEHLPELQIHEVASGTQCFDWTVPKEWSIREAWLQAPDGTRIADFSQNNLHLVGYSVSVDKKISLSELQAHLYSLPDQPEAIPYITSYYKERWGFCIPHNLRKKLSEGEYRVYIDSSHVDGSLNYGELFIPGETDKEVFISTYVCHPSMANNELSGPVVAVGIALWLLQLNRRRRSYRIVFVPETIGSITYLSKNLAHLKKHMIAGFNLTCIGDERCYSYLPSRDGNTLADRAVRHALHHIDPQFKVYSWADRGSDERQYCSPGIDLPVASIMRSKYHEYPEYHTSLDDLSLVTPAGLQGGWNAVKSAIEAIEIDFTYQVTVLGEPQLGKRGLYPNVSTKDTKSQVAVMMDLISYCDGKKSLLEIAETLGQPIATLAHYVNLLSQHGLLVCCEDN